MDDACMKRAAKNGFWLITTSWTLFFIFAVLFKITHKGLYNSFISFCCNDDFNAAEIARGVLLLIIFNLIIWLIIVMQINSQKPRH